LYAFCVCELCVMESVRGLICVCGVRVCFLCFRRVCVWCCVVWFFKIGVFLLCLCFLCGRGVFCVCMCIVCVSGACVACVCCVCVFV